MSNTQRKQRSDAAVGAYVLVFCVHAVYQGVEIFGGTATALAAISLAIWSLLIVGLWLGGHIAWGLLVLLSALGLANKVLIEPEGASIVISDYVVPVVLLLLLLSPLLRERHQILDAVA